MAKQTIDTSGQTDLLYQGFAKTNANFTEVYESIIQTGMMIDYWGTSAPSGWVLADGGSIGGGTSNEENLFVLIWNSLTDTEAPVSGGRGLSAEDDFNALKTITLPDLRGRVSVGKNAGTFSILGGQVGDETHALTEAELPIVANHTHDIGDSASVASGGDFNVFSNTTSSPSPSQSSGGFGSGTTHNNIQPSIVCNKIIKL